MTIAMDYPQMSPEEIPDYVKEGFGLIRFDRDGGVYIFPHEGQRWVLNSKKRFIFVLAGTQGGKTSLGPIWLDQEIHRRGEGDYLAVTSTYQLFDNKLLPELTKFFCEIQGNGRFHPGKNVIEIADPSTGKFWAKTSNDKMYARILLRSATTGRGEVSVGRLEAATAKAALLDECGMDDFTLQAWESIKRRVGIHRGRVLGITTLYNFDWLHNEIYVPWLQGEKPDVDIFQFDSIMNPAFPIEEYEDAKKTLPPWKFDMQYRGIYSRPGGSIYADFDPAVHVVDPFTVPLHWAVTVGIDPGSVNTGVVYIARNPDDGLMYLFKESLNGNLTSAQHAKQVKAVAAPFTTAKYYGGATSEKQFRMDWQAAGCPVQQPLVSDVWSGIDRVLSLIKSGKFKIFRTCSMTIAQMIEYARKIDAAGNQTEEIKDKNKYHLLDALRYAAPGVNTGAVISRRQSQNRNRKQIPGIGISSPAQKTRRR